MRVRHPLNNTVEEAKFFYKRYFLENHQSPLIKETF